MVPKVTSVLTGAFCYFCTWVVQVLRGVFHMDISFICWLRVIRIPFFLFWDFAAEEVDGVGDKWPGIPQQLMYRHSVHVPEIFLFHWWIFLPETAKLLVLGLLSPSSGLSGFLNYWTSEIKGMLLYFVYLGCDIEENLLPYPFAVISKYSGPLTYELNSLLRAGRKSRLFSP